MRYLVSLLFFLASPVYACGPDTDCPIGARHYRVAMPDGHDGATPVAALVWSHGFGGSAAGVMRNGSIRRMLSDAGIALIAVQGIEGRWALPYSPGFFDSDGSAEFAFFDAVLNDATARFAIDPARIIASGFSLGGMMVWNLACSHPERFSGFIPISGTFWLKPPHDCEGPVRSLVHIHGTQDKTVPLIGRRIRETKQGEVAAALITYERFGAFGAAEKYKAGTLSCEVRRNGAGDVLDFCLFEGGHSFRTEHLAHGIAKLREAGAL
ncbi:MAG: polyhydroxybutyrate depolymerase [Pseudomonadota bacterium]